MFIEILFKMLLFKGGVLIYAEHCIYSIYVYIYIYITYLVQRLYICTYTLLYFVILYICVCVRICVGVGGLPIFVMDLVDFIYLYHKLFLQLVGG